MHWEVTPWRPGEGFLHLSPYTHDIDAMNVHSCHLGRTIRFDSVSKLGWSVDVRTHGIEVIVERLLGVEWEEGVPEPLAEDDCVVCPPGR